MDINIEEIINRFEPELIKNIDYDNMKKILKFLTVQNIECLEDIITEYFDLFSIPYSDFIAQFQQLNDKYENKLVMLVEQDLSILEEFLIYKDRF